MELKLQSLIVVRENLYALLIVPYGIETEFCSQRRFRLFTFNRTLWN